MNTQQKRSSLTQGLKRVFSLKKKAGKPNSKFKHEEIVHEEIEEITVLFIEKVEMRQKPSEESLHSFATLEKTLDELFDMDWDLN